MEAPNENPESTSKPEQSEPVKGELNLENANIESVQGENVHISQSSVHQIAASQVSLNESYAQEIDSTSITAQDSNIGQAHAETMSMKDSNVGMAYTQEATISGNTGAAIAQTVTLNECRTGFLVAREVHGGHIHSAIMLAGRVDGPIETAIDARKALVIGVAAGAVMGIVAGFFKLFIQKRG